MSGIGGAQRVGTARKGGKKGERTESARNPVKVFPLYLYMYACMFVVVTSLHHDQDADTRVRGTVEGETTIINRLYSISCYTEDTERRR